MSRKIKRTPQRELSTKEFLSRPRPIAKSVRHIHFAKNGRTFGEAQKNLLNYALIDISKRQRRLPAR